MDLHPCKGCTVSKLSFGIIFRYMPLPGRAFARPGLFLMADSVLGFSLSQSDQNAVNILSQADFIQEMHYYVSSVTISANKVFTSIIPQNISWQYAYVITYTITPNMMTQSSSESFATGDGILRITPDSGVVYIPSKYQKSTYAYIGTGAYSAYKIEPSLISFITMTSGTCAVAIHATFAFFL